MDKVVLSEDDFSKMHEWRNAHQELRLNINELPLKAFELVCDGFRCKYIQDGGTLTAYPCVNNIRVCKIEAFLVNPFAKLLEANEKRVMFSPMIKNKTALAPLKKDAEEEYDLFCRMTVNYYTLIMAYMAFGNNDRKSNYEFVTSSPTHHASSKRSKKRGKGITYIFQKRQYVSKGGHHASPSYEFSVRGHYRKYKSGKTVWIAEYLKGIGKHKNKTYKFGGI